MTLPLPLSALLPRVRMIAREAGQAILDTRLQGGDVEEKSDGSPVTRADMAAERVILAGLDALRPRFPIVSEESDSERPEAAAAETFWLVDPLDGTKEFIKGLPEYTVNIALVHGGEPLLGVIYIPPLDSLYEAARGVPARCLQRGRETRLRPGPVERLERAVVSRSHLSPATAHLLDRLGIATRVPSGSSLKMCAIAEGRADLYPRLGPTRLWDTAAGTAIAREAGCTVVDLSGKPLSYELGAGLTHSGFLVAAPGVDVAACIAAIALT